MKLVCKTPFKEKFMTIQSLLKPIEVHKSMTRILKNFRGVDANPLRVIPIFEGSTQIGVIQEIAKNIFAISFRGSFGFMEVAACLNMTKVNCEKAKLNGKMHAGTYTTFLGIRKAVLQAIDQMVPKELDERQITVIVEGHSRGAMIAIAIAAYISQKKIFKLILYTYSAMGILDQEAANDFRGKVPNHLDFVAEGDFVPNIANRFNFQRVGTKISFTPTNCNFFNFYVRQRKFPYFMLQNVYINSFINKFIISSESWTAHMPDTYLEGAPVEVQKLVLKGYSN